MGHKIADPDSFGACMGIYRAAVSLEKKAHIVINEVTGSVRPLYDEILESPAYEDDIFITSEQALDYVDDNAMVIVVDTNKPQMTECPELLKKSKMQCWIITGRVVILLRTRYFLMWSRILLPLAR